MKMITAIINKEDTGSVCRALTEAGFSFTKLATTGGFLMSGNTTLLIGVEDDKVDAILQAVRAFDEESPALGLRAFVWGIEKSY